MEASGVSPEGFYVLLQKDNDGLNGEDQLLHVGDFAAFGEYSAEIPGCTWISLHIPIHCFEEKTNIGEHMKQ